MYEFVDHASPAVPLLTTKLAIRNQREIVFKIQQLAYLIKNVHTKSLKSVIAIQLLVRSLIPPLYERFFLKTEERANLG